MLPILPLTQEPSKPYVLKERIPEVVPQAGSIRRDSFLVLTAEPTSLMPQQRPHTFLELAPVHSDNYSIIRHNRRSTNSSAASSSAIMPSPQTSPLLLPTEANAITSVRRSASVSSTSSDGKFRSFLRLAPVHDGEDDDECAIDE